MNTTTKKHLVRIFSLMVFIPMVFTSSVAATSQMTKMKNAACNIVGFLDSTNSDTMAMVARSSCYFLQRASDPWGKIPDFAMIKANLATLQAAAPSKSFVFGVFIPEAIPNTEQTVVDLAGATHTFEFENFCVSGTTGEFGSGTCAGDITNPQYQSYLVFLVNQMTQLGITVFQFGQVMLMDPNLLAGGLYPQLRAAGAKLGATILISGQTAEITDPTYLGNFDFIVGGTYMNRFGSVIPDGQVSGVGAQTTTSALLWADQYRTVAKNVFIETDWWNTDDDVHRFAEMSSSDRFRVVQSLYNFYANLGVGFVVPFNAALNDGITIASTCYGKTTSVYSASRTYCDDEDNFNAMLNKGPQPSATQNLALNPIVLHPGDSIENLTGTPDAVKLTMQSDGNFVAFNNSGQTLWSSNTGGRSCSGCTAAIQADGNTVLYDANKNPYWRTGTSGYSGAELMVSTTAPYVQVIDPQQDILWMSSNTFSVLNLPQNAYVKMGNTKIVMQADGNLVVDKGSTPVWSTDAPASGGCGANLCQMNFHSTGNLIVSANTQNLWTSKTGGNSGSQLVLSTTAPYLEILDSNNEVIWEAQ